MLEKPIPKEVPKDIADMLQHGVNAYAKSEATTNAGWGMRFLSRFISVRQVIQVLTHLIAKK